MINPGYATAARHTLTRKAGPGKDDALCARIVDNIRHTRVEQEVVWAQFEKARQALNRAVEDFGKERGDLDELMRDRFMAQLIQRIAVAGRRAVFGGIGIVADVTDAVLATIANADLREREKSLLRQHSSQLENIQIQLQRLRQEENKLFQELKRHKCGIIFIP
ncbi:MAG: hypothetical protein Tsb0016_06030 [Sphingomonadales bacterium]